MSGLFIPPPSEWPEELRVLQRERACIAEFDGGLSREAAEELATAEIWGNSEK